MSKTETYRRHHKELHELVLDLESHLDAKSIAQNPEDVATIVRQLFGKFGTHLAIEDKAFYPKAISHQDQGLSTLAKKFQDEMGGLSESFNAYRRAFPGPLAISNDPEGFVAQSKEVIKAFKYRLHREETELYELFDKVA